MKSTHRLLITSHTGFRKFSVIISFNNLILSVQGEGPSGVMAYVLDCSHRVSKLELQLHYYVHLGKV